MTLLVEEFKAFSEIKHLTKITMQITQKIHGTNAHVYITDDLKIYAASRTRFIFPGDDNYGFAAWVEKNKDDLIRCLGPGRHYGEWAGPGINSGEGLKEKTFVLFSLGRYTELPPNCVTVPLLYEGDLSMERVKEAMEDLRINGSALVANFMRPEGIVVSFGGMRFKKVFEAEETKWRGPSKEKSPSQPKEVVDYGHLLQPIRLEKLLSRDERYLRDFPQSLPIIMKDYVEDLTKEGQIVGSEEEQAAIRKGATGQIFKFIKEFIKEKTLA